MAKQVYAVEVNGETKIFGTAAEAREYEKKPLILKALQEIDGIGEDLADWFFENKDSVFGCFKAGSPRRVTKKERETLRKELEEVDSPFVSANMDAIVNSFRWPSVKRDSDKTRDEMIMEELNALTEDEESSQFIVDNRAALEQAFKAGAPEMPRIAIVKGTIYRLNKKIDKLENEGDEDKEIPALRKELKELEEEAAELEAEKAQEEDKD